MSGPRNTRRRGMALLISLLIVVLLAVLVIQFSYEVQVDAALVENQVDDYKAYMAAKSAVGTGLGLLSADYLEEEQGGEPYDTYLDLWYTQTHPDDLPYGLWQQMPSAEGVEEGPQSEFLVLVEDEFGKIPLNALIDPRDPTVPREEVVEVLRNLFAQLGADEDPTDAIVDWIDEDEQQFGNGAESDYYEGLGVPYRCKNAPMSNIEELLMIRGITPELYFGNPEEEIPPLYELLTVHGNRRGRVNANTAPYLVLLAIQEFTGAPIADAMFEERLDAPWPDRDSLATLSGMPQQDPQAPIENHPLDFFVYRSSAFHVQGDGMSNGAKVRIDAYVWRDAENAVERFRVLDWRVTR